MNRLNEQLKWALNLMIKNQPKHKFGIQINQRENLTT